MKSSQSILKRLTELKKISVELKQSTEQKKQVNLNLIYGIIESTKAKIQMPLRKTPKQKQSPSKPSFATNSSNLIEPYKPLFIQNQNKKQRQWFSSNINPNKKQKQILPNHDQIQFSQRLQNDKFIEEGYQYDYYGKLNYNNQGQNQVQEIIQSPQTQQQISKLRQQNMQLQKSLVKIKKQIEQLKSQSQLKQQPRWKQGLPFFKLNQPLLIFNTKLQLNQSDWSLVDYTSHNVQLNLDVIKISKINKINPINKINHNIKIKVLDLRQLYQVFYVDSTVVVLKFGINPDMPNHNDDQQSLSDKDNYQQLLFIKFYNQEQLHKWDLAFFINFKILQSLKKNKLFASSKNNKSRKHSNESRKNQHDLQTNNKSKRSSTDHKQITNKLIQRDTYMQNKNFTLQEQFQKPLDKVSKQKNLNYFQGQQYSQTQQMQIQYPNLGDSSIVSRNLFNTILHDQQQKQEIQKQRNNTSKFKQFTNLIDPLSIPNLDLLNIKSQQQRSLSFNPGHFQLNSTKLEQKIKQDQVNKQQILKNNKIQQIIKKMTIQGYDLTKYSKDGFSPHQKRIFISKDLKLFCWQQEEGKGHKAISLDSIKEIQYQKIGEGIRKHIKKPKKTQHCIISYEKDKKIKLIELGANSTLMAQFVEQLITLKQYINP